MYNIIKENEIIATVDRIQHCKKQRNGVIVLCEAKDAQGIVAAGEIHHLIGCPPLDGYDTVTYEEFDGADMLAAIEEALNE